MCEEDNGDVFMCDQVKYEENRRENIVLECRAVMLRRNEKKFLASISLHKLKLYDVATQSIFRFRLEAEKRVLSSLLLENRLS